MLPAAMDESPAMASTKPRSTDFSIAAIMSKETTKTTSPNDSPTKTIGNYVGLFNMSFE